MHTDTQQHAYVLPQSQQQAPDYLTEALKKGNQLQDIFSSQFAAGESGNQVLRWPANQIMVDKLRLTVVPKLIRLFS